MKRYTRADKAPHVLTRYCQRGVFIARPLACVSELVAGRLDRGRLTVAWLAADLSLRTPRQEDGRRLL